MKILAFALLVAIALVLEIAPAHAVGGVARDPGYLTQVDQAAIETLQDKMGDRADAQYTIGRIYERGGLDREAHVWMQKSANAGYPQAKAWMSEQKVKAEFKSRKGHMLASSRRSLSKGE
jgi:TPR repeat protein